MNLMHLLSMPMAVLYSLKHKLESIFNDHVRNHPMITFFFGKKSKFSEVYQLPDNTLGNYFLFLEDMAEKYATLETFHADNMSNVEVYDKVKMQFTLEVLFTHNALERYAHGFAEYLIHEHDHKGRESFCTVRLRRHVMKVQQMCRLYGISNTWLKDFEFYASSLIQSYFYNINTTQEYVSPRRVNGQLQTQ